MNTNPALAKVNNLIVGLVSAISFLVPWFFLTITYEFFEFNKIYLFIVIVCIMALMWSAKMILEKKVGVAKSPLDLPLILIITSYALSSMTSLDRTASLFGSYGRWFPGLFVIVALYIFYYLISTNVDSVKKIKAAVWFAVTGSVIASILGLINYFGLVLPLMGLQNRTGFLVSGTSYATASIAFVGAAVALMLSLNSKQAAQKLVCSIILTVNFIAATVFGGAIFGIALLTVVAILVLKSQEEDVQKSKAFLFPTAGAVVMFLVLFFLVPQTKNILQRNYPKEVVPSVQESWIISSTTLRDFPIFGTGASTFYLNYPRYRTLDQNYTNTWNIRFDKPFNELMNVISTLGIFGVIAYGIFIVVSVKLCMRSIRVNDPYRSLALVLTAGFIASLVLMALTYASFQSTFMLFLFMGLMTAETVVNTNKNWAKVAVISLSSKTQEAGAIVEDQQIIYRKEILHYIVALPIVALSVFGIYEAVRQYLPEYYVRKAVDFAAIQNIEQSYDYQSKAIAANPNRSEYHRLYASTNIAVAQSMLSGESVSDQQKTAAQNLLAQAIRNIKYITETLNPLDPANWEARANVYALLIPAAADADQFAIQAYNNAIQLDPTNPILRVSLGGIYYGKQDYLSAGNLFKQAVNLKSDYANARYNLGYALYQLKAYNEAKTEFEAVQSLVQVDSEDYKRVTADLEQVKILLAQSAAAETKPSVETIERAASTTDQPTTPAVQEPLKKPGENVPTE